MRQTAASEDVASNVTPERIPEPWLADSVWLLEELAKTREQILRVPLRLDNASDIKSAIDRIWSLEEHLRYLLRLRAEAQWSFAKRAAGSPAQGAGKTSVAGIAARGTA